MPNQTVGPLDLLEEREKLLVAVAVARLECGGDLFGRDVKRCEQDLHLAGLSENTVVTYVDRSERFLRCLVGAYRHGR